MPRPKAYDSIDCNCGGRYTKYNKERHTLTKIHLRYILSLPQDSEEYRQLFSQASYYIWHNALSTVFDSYSESLLGVYY